MSGTVVGETTVGVGTVVVRAPSVTGVDLKV
jgi:C-terminal processing protease CtpA/Prc